MSKRKSNKLNLILLLKIIGGLLLAGVIAFLVIGLPIMSVTEDPNNPGYNLLGIKIDTNTYIGDYELLNENCVVGGSDYIFNKDIKSDIENAIREEYKYLYENKTDKEQNEIFYWKSIGIPTGINFVDVSINLPIIGTENLVQFINKITENLPENIVVQLSHYSDSVVNPSFIKVKKEPNLSFLTFDPTKKSCIYDSSYLSIKSFASKNFIDNLPNRPICIDCTKE